VWNKTKKKEAVECVKLLNEFGRVIIVENEVLVDYVVVDMVWIQNIINHLFQTKESWSSHGIFERKALESMWRKDGYPSKIYDVLIHLLQKYLSQR